MAVIAGITAGMGETSLIIAGYYNLAIGVGILLLVFLGWLVFLYRSWRRDLLSRASCPETRGSSPVPIAAGNLPEGNFLRTLVNNLPDCIGVKDAQGRFLFANSALAWFVGAASPEELQGKRMIDLIPSSFAAQFAADDETVFQTGQPLVRVERFGTDRLRNPRWLAYTNIPLPDAQGRTSAIVSVSRDITGRKQAEENLRLSEKRYRVLIECLPQHVFYKDAHSAFVSVNAAFAKGLGREPGELTGKTDFDLFPKELAEKYRADDIRVMMQRRPETIEEINVASGKDRIVEVVKTPVFDDQNNVIGLLGLFTDITERKQAEQKLRAFASQLQHSNRELQDFAYVASHDLQEPLRKVNVFSDRLKAKCGQAIGPEGTHYLDRIQDATKRMQTLINDLLSFSRITTQTHPFAPVNLNLVVRGVLSDLEARIEQDQAKVEVGDLPTIEADALQMRQLFQNLIGNALKYHKPEVSPVVQVQSQLVHVQADASGSSSAAPERCQISVVDNGIGFDEKYSDRIFQVFQRLHNRAEYEGSGMGLAICRKIADRHNGEIVTRSTPGVGSTFIVTLPVKQPKGDKTA